MILTINFSAFKNKEKFVNGAKEYKKIWDVDGKAITHTIEKISGLQFKNRTIEAIIHGRKSSGHTSLLLKYSYSEEIKKAVLIHELCHVLMVQNDLYINSNTEVNNSIIIHQALNLILFDIWVEVYGEIFARTAVDYECDTSAGRPEIFTRAWNWALEFNKNERRKMFDLVKENPIEAINSLASD